MRSLLALAALTLLAGCGQAPVASAAPQPTLAVTPAGACYCGGGGH